MKYWTQGIVLSREFKKASDAWKDDSGKEIKAQPKRWYAHLVIGELQDDKKVFFDGEIRQVIVQVTQAQFKALTEIKVVTCRVEHKGTRIKVVEVNELDLVQLEEDKDDISSEDEDEDETE